VHDLIAITPLGSDVARQDRVGALTLTEVPDWALASVAARPGQEDACHAALTAFLTLCALAGSAALLGAAAGLMVGRARALRGEAG